jgi:osmotically inducible protein OsmC
MATDRNAKVTWTGSLMEGVGPDRRGRQRGVRPAGRDLGIARRGAGRSTSPEELIAAAWARASRWPSPRAAGAGTPPERLETSVTVTFQPGEGIVKGAIEVVGTVPGVDRDGFVEQAEGAVKNCPVSKALTGIPDVTLAATLASA